MNVNIEKLFIGVGFIAAIIFVGILEYQGKVVNPYWWMLISACGAALGALGQPNGLANLLATMAKNAGAPGAADVPATQTTVNVGTPGDAGAEVKGDGKTQ